MTLEMEFTLGFYYQKGKQKRIKADNTMAKENMMRRKAMGDKITTQKSKN